MDVYEVIVTPDAMRDLIEIRDYIAYVLLVPETALLYIETIRKEIKKLEVLPAKHKIIDIEPWKTRGVRKIIAKKFYIYYRIDEDKKRVYILNVIYERRDQLRQLAKKIK